MSKALAVVGVVVLILLAVLFLGRPFLVVKNVTIEATEDAYVDQTPSQSGSNFGTAQTIDVRNLNPAGADISYLRRSLVRFEFSSLGAIERLDRATLKLNMVACTLNVVGGTDTDWEVWRITGGGGSDWTESTATWNSNSGNGFTASLLATQAMTTTCPSTAGAGTEYTFDVTTTVRAWAVDGASNLGFWVIPDYEGQLTNDLDELRYGFASRERGSPKLEIDYAQPGAGGEPGGVTPGGNETTNQTGGEGPPPPPPSLTLPIFAFVLVLLVALIVGHRRPVSAIALGVVIGGVVAAIVYVLQGGGGG